MAHNKNSKQNKDAIMFIKKNLHLSKSELIQEIFNNYSIPVFRATIIVNNCFDREIKYENKRN